MRFLFPYWSLPNSNKPTSGLMWLIRLPDTFMFSGVTTSTELYKSRVMVRMKDLEPSVSFKIYKPENINKQEWEEFLRLYNLLSLI
ncbi:hypothetical protein N8270_05615 [Polaribacter sp.]|nr:hypothetical protein [Polaribacter sp.]